MNLIRYIVCIIIITMISWYFFLINSNNTNNLFVASDNSEKRSQHYIYNYTCKFGHLRPSKNMLTSILISNDSFENIKNVSNPNGAEEYNYIINGIKLLISKSFVYFNGKKYKTEDYWFYIKDHKFYPILKNAKNTNSIIDDYETSCTNFTKQLNAKTPRTN